jgi:hypothetical protein
MDYPVLAPRRVIEEEEQSFFMSSMGSVFTVGSTNSLMRGEPQTTLMKPPTTGGLKNRYE